MTDGTSRRLQMQENKMEVVTDETVLEESKDRFEILLECQIEPQLKWHKQVEEL